VGSSTCMRTTHAGHVVSRTRDTAGKLLVSFRTIVCFIYDIVLYVYIYRERERESEKRERCIVAMYKYIYIYVSVSDLLIYEDRQDWYCTQCGAYNIRWARKCPDCDYPKQPRIILQDDFFIYDMVVHVMYKCMHEAFTGRSSGSGCLPAMAAPPMDGHGGSAHGSVVCSGRSGGPVCTRHGIGSAVETSPPPGPGIAAMGS